MKIVFLCGCLEPGCDGVGDYTARLASELILQDHNVSAISLVDDYKNEVFTEKQHIKNVDFPVMRLPSKLNNAERIKLVNEWINKYDPDWISLQFVIYSYHPKGLPLGLTKLMAGIGNHVKWHVMFHEIWVGIGKTSSLKHKIIGQLQKKIIVSMIKLVNPKLITTSNILYSTILKTINIDSIVLPLFSNIAIAPLNKNFVCSVLNKLGINSEEELMHWRLAGSFGTLRPDANFEQILKDQLFLCESEQLNMAFIAFGRIGDIGIAEFNRLEKILGNIKFINLGEQSQENISNVMQLLNIGISSTPLSYIGKSGVFSIMKFHGLDVIIPGDEQFPEYLFQLKKHLSEISNKNSNIWSVSRIAKNFLKLLS
ncbi:hypothetical protein [Mucilaginibacter sp. UYCu711]|uniref:hypothetical protein n=1 Tax=Mucilaginibacter sp. UYCu711 TaxID=3156339 RepID=UPI003D19E6B2